MTYLAGAALVLSTACLIYFVAARSHNRSQAALNGDDKTPTSQGTRKLPLEEKVAKPARSIQNENDARQRRAGAHQPRSQVLEHSSQDGNIGQGLRSRITTPADEASTATVAGSDRSITESSQTLPPFPRQDITTMSPPRLKPPSFSQSPGSMPPPPRPTGSSLRPPPSVASTLRAPPRPQSLSASTLPANGTSSSRAVKLSPGHSPLDWATLTHDAKAIKKLRGEDAVRISLELFASPYSLLRVPPTTLRRFNGRKGRDAWTSYNGRVYNISAYLPFHPGGEPEILKGAGRGSEKLFAEVHPWVNWEGMLNECCVGIVVGEEDDRAIKVDRDGNVVAPAGSGAVNPLDEMD